MTDELKAKIAPIRAAVRDNLKAREDRVKLRRRTHKASRPAAKPEGGEAASGSATPMEVDGVEDEAEVRKREGDKVRELVRAAAGEEAEAGTNWSGLYELSGESFRGRTVCRAGLMRMCSDCHAQGAFG